MKFGCAITRIVYRWFSVLNLSPMKSKLIAILICFTLLFAKETLSQNVIRIPIVVHVLYNQPSDSIPAELIQTIILDSVNADFRRQNLNAVHTQTAYLPIAADTEIEFRFAETDPDGNSTTGIIYKYTDQTAFNWELNRGMMYDSLGGASSWDECRYLNVWICSFGELTEYANQWNGTAQGIAVSRLVFTETTSQPYFRYLTHEFGHFLHLSSFTASQTCVDTDWVSDTPIQSQHPPGLTAYLYPDSIFPETNCFPLPNGRIAGNFMGPVFAGGLYYLNMFTLGQKERMRNFISEHFPGYIDPNVSCFTGIEEEAVDRGFEVYPNPSSGQLTVTAKRSSQNLVLQVFDATGKEISSEPWSLTNGAKELQLPSGLYFITLSGDSFSETKKVVIQ